VLPDLLMELASAEVWVAHNAAFDIDQISQEYIRSEHSELELPPLVCCTMQLSSYFSNVPGHKLAQVAERYGVKPDGAHRAVADALVCGAVFHEMTKSGKLPDSLHEMQELGRRAEKAWKTRSRR
jgi:DNA polymerase III epsilon subunit-like protein